METPTWEEYSPPDSPAAWRWLLFAVLGYLFASIFSEVLLQIAGALSHNTKDLGALAAEAVPPGWVTICLLGGVWIGFAGAAVAAIFVGGTRSVVRDLGLRVRKWDPLLGVAVGVAGQYGIGLLYEPFERISPTIRHDVAAPAAKLTGGFPGADLWVIGILTVCVVPVFEELLFRGVVLRALIRIGSRSDRAALAAVFAVVVDGIIFGLAHFEPVNLPGLALFGMVLATLAYKSGRLGPSLFAHGSFNLVAIVWIGHIGSIRW